MAKVAEADAHRLGIDHGGIARHLKIGGSIAINGCCLTIVQKRGSVFFADVVPETLRRTNLGTLAVGSPVNLEMPLTSASTLDGHLVKGHVDTTARVKTVGEASSGRELTIELPASIARFVATKGSIAVDGVSLTVAGVGKPARTFRVALIPHTLEMTIAGGYTRGSVVNLEADVVARYVARNLRR